MNTSQTVGFVLAALELAPADPSDVTGILRSPRQRNALLGLDPNGDMSPLTHYLRVNTDRRRADHWARVLEDSVGEHGFEYVMADDPLYPKRLASIWDAPPILFMIGSLATIDKPAIAIVGSRATTGEILTSTKNVAHELSAHGYDIVSGLASGVDTAAHWGALYAGGRTTAILGTGINVLYPEQNSKLARQIGESGVLISQFAPGSPRTSTSFLRRNSVIAAMADLSLVMAGRKQSGSRQEIEQAIRYNRRALLWAPTLEKEEWAASLVNQGRATFVDSVEQIIDLGRKGGK